MYNSVHSELQQAAKRLEDLLNMLGNQIEASIDSFNVKTIGSAIDQKHFQIKIISTQPVQIYPPNPK